MSPVMPGTRLSFTVMLLGLCLCPSVSNSLSCEMSTSCVHCSVFGGGDYAPVQCAKLCGDLVFNVVSNVEGIEGVLCQFRDQNWCYYEYVIDDRALLPVLHVNKDKVCLGRK